jgi:hypothetical protein
MLALAGFEVRLGLHVRDLLSLLQAQNPTAIAHRHSSVLMCSRVFGCLAAEM